MHRIEAKRFRGASAQPMDGVLGLMKNTAKNLTNREEKSG